MPRQSISRSAHRILAGEAEHLIPLRFDIRMHPEKSKDPNRLIGSVGGLWNVLEQRYVGPGDRARVLYLMDGQRETAEWWFAWLRAYTSGDWATFERQRGPRDFALWTVGGRRRGKSYVGMELLAAFAVAIPGVTPWLVQPTEDDFLLGKELPNYWHELVPPSWFEWNERELYCQLINGSRVLFKSAHDGRKLKAGSVDYCFFNEAQLVDQLGYDNVMGGISDTGSLCHVAANPPRDSKGFWVQDLVGNIQRGQLRAKLFDYRHDNPFVVEDALDALAGQMSARDYAIEREGRFMARPDVVLHEFEEGDRGHVRRAPASGDVTEAFVQARFNLKGIRAIVGMDFQRTPFQVATVKLVYPDPADPSDVVTWTVGEYYVEQGDEDDLVNELERDAEGRPGLRGGEVLVIADGTGDYQQSDRARGRMTGRGSWDMLRARGWRHIFSPSPWINGNNPPVEERVIVANGRLRSADGRMHAFVDPRCVRTIEDLKKWQNDKRGRPSRYSPHAHMGDAWTYVEYRLWPRRFVAPKKAADVHVVNIFGRDDRAWP